MAKLSQERRLELESEREFLLTSLADLETERDEGGIDAESFATLHSDYTARTAAVLRALAGGTDNRQKAPPIPKGRRWSVIASIVVFAGAGAFALSKSVGTRAPGDTITGNSAAKIDPKSYRGHLAQAQTWAASRNFSGATTEFLAAAKLRPDLAEPLTALAEMLIQRNVEITNGGGAPDARLLEEALTLCERSIGVDPKYAQSYLYKGLILTETGRPAAIALPMFRKYLALSPNGAQAAMARSVIDRLTHPVTTSTTKP